MLQVLAEKRERSCLKGPPCVFRQCCCRHQPQANVFGLGKGSFQRLIVSCPADLVQAFGSVDVTVWLIALQNIDHHGTLPLVSGANELTCQSAALLIVGFG